MTEVVSTNVNVNDELLFEEHYTALLPELLALSPDELMQVNVEITTAVTTVFGAQAEIVALSPRIEKELPEFDVAKLKRLHEYAMALSYAQTLYSMASQPTDSVQAHVEEGATLRDLLQGDASALVRRGLLNARRLKELRGTLGYKNLAFDLQLFAAVFLESFDKLEGKCGTQRDELHRANRLAATILRAVGIKEQGTAAVASTTDLRLRAFTLFSRAYDQARRAVTYLRWNEDDIDSIAPSLYAGRGGRKKVSSDLPKPAEPTAPTAASGSTAAVSPATPISTPAQPNATAAGTPGAQPFIS